IMVDVAAGRIVRDGRDHALRLKSWDVLVLLLENRQRVVPKDELLAAVWAGVHVDENAIVQCIADVRRALGDEARTPRYVRRIPKVGYRLVADVTERPSFVLEEVRSVEIEITGQTAPTPPRPVRSRRAVALAAVAVALAALGTWLGLRRGTVE